MNQLYAIVVCINGQDKILDKVIGTEDQAFEYADLMFPQYSKDIELFELGHPRHQKLFDSINQTIFRGI